MSTTSAETPGRIAEALAFQLASFEPPCVDIPQPSAISFRARRTDWQYGNVFKTIGASGMRTQEPDPIVPETSQVATKVIELEREEFGGIGHISDQTGIPAALILSITFGFPRGRRRRRRHGWLVGRGEQAVPHGRVTGRHQRHQNKT